MFLSEIYNITYFFLFVNFKPIIEKNKHNCFMLKNNKMKEKTSAHLSTSLQRNHYIINHFSTTGRCSGPAHYDVSIWQAARAAFVTSSFKISLTQTFPRCGATCYILPSRAMTQLFNGVNFVYRSVEVYLTFCSYLRVLVRVRNFYNGGRN